MITSEQLKSHLVSLRQQEQEHTQDLLAVKGAIQFCESLIARDAEAEAPKESGPQLVPDKPSGPSDVVEVPAPSVQE